jgi:diguanylate cyclase (GGDEF)-like protein/hemerythrin-like metal-binding protein/PAS domain S-box-containing protein
MTAAWKGLDVSTSEALFRAMIHAGPLPMFVISEGRCVYGNDRFIKMRGCADGECTLCGLGKFLDEANNQLLSQAIANLKHGEVARMPLHLRREDGQFTAIDLSMSGMEMGGKTFVLAIVNEKTEKERLRRLLDRLAFHDSLTELPNRVLLFDRINQSLSRSMREHEDFAVGVLDLDGFKPINDTLGHAAGDLLLKEISRRLRHSVRNVDTVARLGGDEFALILQGVSSVEEADSVLNKIILEVARPYHLDGTEMAVTASIGIAFSPRDGASIHELLGRADYAMYLAKNAGGACYRISNGEIAPISSRHQLEPLIDVVKLGFEIIDEQHEEIAASIRAILQGISGNESKVEIKHRAKHLQLLTQTHFNTEEDYMLRYAPDGQEMHRSEHADLLHSLQGLQENHDQHGFTVLAHSFKEWLLPHIETQDAGLVEQLRAAGITA